jgi:hypothetical protein
MNDRRIETRMLCSDLIDITWKDKTGRSRHSVANLEDISLSGACVQVDRPFPLNTVVRINHQKGELSGIVRYCVYREIGYFLGVEFEPGSRWSLREFRPQHLLDPRSLVMRTISRNARQNQQPSVQ